MDHPRSALGRDGDITLVEGAVYEFHKPLHPDKVGVEIVFMHGLQPGDFKNAYWKTWLTRDGSSAWPKTWLGDDYPNARILSLCYDTSVWKTPTTGNLDADQLSNKILQLMVMPNAMIGQSDCPVIFVCHSLGGLMAKEILLKAVDSQDEMVKKLFNNMKGIFFFATPHLGSMLANSCVVGFTTKFKSMSPMVEYLKVLNTRSSSLNQEFLTKFAHKFGREWKVYVAAEGSMTIRCKIFKAWIVEAASANLYGSKFIMVDGVDHKTVCKPALKEDQGYIHLKSCINEVIAHHSERADHLEKVPSSLFGIDAKRLEAIGEKLKEVSIIGLVGMGGVGKTTLSKVFYNSVLTQYEKSAYLENVASRVMKDVQLQLYCSLFPYIDSNKETHEKQLAQIKECLTTKKVLLVIDDVETFKDTLQELQIEDSQNEKIKVIVTCRDQGVLEQYKVDDPKFEVSTVKVNGINDDQGSDWKFFCHHAFHGIEDHELSNNPFRSVARNIVDQCQGLPLSLEVIGKYLKEVNSRTNICEAERKQMWDEAFQRLQNAQSLRGGSNDKLWSCLQISFDKLFEDIEKELFLAFACLFCEVPQLRRRTIAEIWNSPNGIEHLIQRSLLKEKDDGCLSIHNQLRDMGRKIVQDRAEHGLLKHMWKEKDILQFLENNESSTTLTGLSLVEEQTMARTMSYVATMMSTIGRSFFLRTRNTGIMRSIMAKMTSTTGRSIMMEEYYDEVEEYHDEVEEYHGEVEEYHGEVEEYHGEVEEYHGEVEEYHGEVEEYHGEVEEYHGEVEEYHGEVEEYHGEVEEYHGEVEEYHGEDEEYHGEVEEYHGEVEEYHGEDEEYKVKAEEYEDKDEEDYEDYQERVDNTMFDMSRAAEDAMIRDASKGYSELKLLHLRLLSKPHVADYCLFKCWEEKLLWFCLDNSKITTKGLQRIWSLKGLRVLQIFRCSELEEIPSSLGDLIQLVELEIFDCHGLKSLPDTISELRHLRRLRLDLCGNLLAIPAGVGQLHELEYLSVSDGSSLQSLCGFELSMRSLRELYICYNDRLTTITGLRNLHNLQILSLKGCSSLHECDLPRSFGQLSKLEKLDLEDCWDLRQEVADALKTGKLDTNRLTTLKLPIFLEACLPHCPELRVLSLENCLGLNELPSELFNVMLKLEKLLLNNRDINTGFKDLPGSLWNLKTLKSLSLWNFGSLKELNPEGIKNLSQLQKLRMHDCRSLERLPVSLGDLPHLSYLEFFGCTKRQWKEESQSSLREMLISRGCTLNIWH